MSDFDNDAAYGGIPKGRGAGQPMCPDCLCPPHRDMTRKGGNQECPRCGCPDLITAKRERDGDRAGDHFPGSERNSNPGFSVDGASFGTSIG